MSNGYDIDPIDRAIYDTVHDYINPATGLKGARGLAPVIAMRDTTLQNKANPTDEFSNLFVKEARAVMLATNDHRILHQLARDVGEVCIPLPTKEYPADMDMLTAWGQWQTEIANTIQAVTEAIQDQRITQGEVARVYAELVDDYAKGLSMLDVLKGMAEPPTPGNLVKIDKGVRHGG